MYGGLGGGSTVTVNGVKVDVTFAEARALSRVRRVDPNPIRIRFFLFLPESKKL